jgi:hypothetical protein
MNEQQWLVSTDPSAMLYFRHWGRHQPSHRKFRLFAVACCRQHWHRFSDWRCQRAVEVAEQFADNKASEEELLAASAAVQIGRKVSAAALVKGVTEKTNCFYASNILHMAARMVNRMLDSSGRGSGQIVALKSESDLVRCIFKNPFRPLPDIDASWQMWNGGTIPKIAQAIYDDRAFDHLPILADALEEAGCTNADILGHCRGPGPHARGCWVVDLLLDKE